MMCLALLLTLGLAQNGEAPTPSQDEASTQAPPPVAEVISTQEGALATLSALRDSREAKLEELQELRDSFDPDTDSELRLQQIEEARKLKLEINQLEDDFKSIATGIDLRTLEMGEEVPIDLVGQLTQFLQPLLYEMRQATESPREATRLSDLLETLDDHQIPLMRTGVENLTALRDAATEEKLSNYLDKTLETWKARLSELENQRRVVKFQLDQRNQDRGSFFESTSSALGNFFRTRGLNLLSAVAAFFGILFLLRLLHQLARRLFRQKPREERPFYARLIDVLYFGMSGVAAVCGSLLVLYAMGDWALLGLLILALLGLGWASKTALPMFFEQIQLLLNLGTVRELERVTVDGLPWRVARISMHAILVNPQLSGGRRRLPLRDLLGLRSRRSPVDEPWFPTNVGDWVLMEDRRPAQVESQTPEFVSLRFKGGSEQLLASADFLNMGAENLSEGFRINQRFGISYDLQGIATNKVMGIMREDVEKGLQDLVAADELIQVTVEFLEAGASSLDYAVIADFVGSAALKYDILRRAMQRLLVETCTREDWEIPFTQVTLHQAKA